ncbi:ATP-dependent DNA helicase chl1 [Trapelia coarctata]|nr:ATP-dependent DNA helicase chl1 [Trapelia coarctata]
MEQNQRDFHHPFQPYSIQLEFMHALYDCLEQGQGKSLSLICGALTWLRDQQLKELEGQSGLDESTEPAWILEHAKKERIAAAVHKKKELETKLTKTRAKELRQKQRYEDGEAYHKKIKLDRGSNLKGDFEDEAQFVLDDYDSEDEAVKKKGGPQGPSDNGLSATSIDLLKKLGMLAQPDTEEDDLQADDELKIFYCSRTHSQLTQFANEVKRVRSPSVVNTNLGVENEEGESSKLSEDIKYLSLGARKNLCINPQVNKLGSATAVSERCLELQQAKTPSEHKCKFLPNKENQPLVNNFRDHTLAKIRDIEDLPELGKIIGICPYYASRASIKPSEVVTLPYPLLLQKSAREALDISLKGHVVIIDEAHNLMDAISNLYSVTLSLSQLERSRAQLGIYLQKFRNKLKGKNRVYVAQVVRLVDSLITYLKTAMNSQTPDGPVLINNLLTGKGVDQINLYKLVRYLQESKLARKVDGYNVHISEPPATSSETRPSTTPVLTHIQSFITTLMNPAKEGDFFYSKTDTDIFLRYLLLDPTNSFREIVDEARAVVLAGGTMSPMEDYTQHFLSYLPPTRIRTLSLGHVIPPSNLLALPLPTGPSGLPFDFTFSSRNNPRMIDELGRAILALARTIPDGLVVFFPSYAYLAQVVSRWKLAPSTPTTSISISTSSHQTGASTLPPQKDSIYNALHTLKPIFSESKTTPVDELLSAYSTAISSNSSTKRGALLLAVIGGSLSEGINFSDELGRGVVVVGLPFPNNQSAEWRAKLKHIDRSAAEAQRSDAGVNESHAEASNGKVGVTNGKGEPTRNDTRDRKSGATAGKEPTPSASSTFYLNTTMRAVNQSIGRAIRHRGDYAAIVLVDRRYGTGRIVEKLPGWIREGMKGSGSGVQGPGAFREAMRSVEEFFAGKGEGRQI